MANRMLAMDEYETTTGLVLKLKPVRSVVYARKAVELKRKFIADGEPVEPPMYTIKTANGEDFQYPLAPELLETGDAEETYHNRLKWAAHLDALGRLAAAQGEAQVIAMLALGVRDYQYPPVEEWQDELSFMGYEMPADDLTRKAYYLIYFELNDMDFQAIRTQIDMLNMGKAVTPERMATFRGSVQSEVELRFDQGVARIEKHLAELTREREAERSDGGPAISGNDDGEGVEPDAE